MRAFLNALLHVRPFLFVAFLGACEIDGPARVDFPADTIGNQIPIQMAGPGGAALIVPVYVNGQGPFDFVLDTGATLTCVDASIVEQLELPERQRTGIGAGVEGTGRMRLVGIDSIRTGSVVAHHLTACMLDLEHMQTIGLQIDGLLGLNFLTEFRVILDFERNVLTLERP